jgi:hypothetical protein
VKSCWQKKAKKPTLCAFLHPPVAGGRGWQARGLQKGQTWQFQQDVLQRRGEGVWLGFQHTLCCLLHNKTHNKKPTPKPQPTELLIVLDAYSGA